MLEFSVFTVLVIECGAAKGNSWCLNHLQLHLLQIFHLLVSCPRYIFMLQHVDQTYLADRE